MQEHLSDISAAGIFAGFGALCGALSYGNAVVDGQAFSFWGFCLNLAISSCCAFFVGEACLASDVPLRVVLAISGMCGWMGPKLPALIQASLTYVILRRAGIDPDKEKR